MARHSFGGGIADYVVQRGDAGELTLAGNAPVTFWTAESDGEQITDLVDGTGTAIPGGVVTSDAAGAIPAFGMGPEDVRAMWASASPTGAGARRLVTATDLGDEVGDLRTRLAALETRLSGVGRLTAGPVAPDEPGIGDVWFDTSAPTEGSPVAFRSASGATAKAPTLTCMLPDQLAPGDYMIALLVFSTNAGESLSEAPDGWTVLQGVQEFGGDTKAAIFGKVYQAGDTAPSWTFAGTTSAVAGIVAYANADPAVQMGAYAVRSNSTAVTDAPSISTTAPDMVVACAYLVKTPGPAASVDPAGTTRRLLQVGLGTSEVPAVLVCDLAQPVVGPTGVKTATVTPTSNNGMGVQIGLKRRVG
ncbi:hypothetical protein [Actinomadura atramentaria]|uniref:hypothetical protein n=1 Tax=Actinomadura atramentaria TaxID=1990 RepID=UPI000375368A|nr:hypothetical protein [Actinomadura atramentaria]